MSKITHLRKIVLHEYRHSLAFNTNNLFSFQDVVNGPQVDQDLLCRSLKKEHLPSGSIN